MHGGLLHPQSTATTRPGPSRARVDTDDGDVPKKGNAAASSDAAGARGGHKVHAPLVLRVNGDVRVPN